MTGSRLKALRKKCGYTQVKVQMLTGIDQSDYSKMHMAEATGRFCGAKRPRCGASGHL